MPNYSWKGNVRELRNVVERLMIMAEKEVIDRKDLPEPRPRRAGPSPCPTPRQSRPSRTSATWPRRISSWPSSGENGWNISQTAREIDTPRSNLYKKLAQYGIKITVGLSDSGGEAPAAEKSEPGSD